MNKFVLCTSHDEFAELLRIRFPESSELPKTLLRLESDGVYTTSICGRKLAGR
jgi:hypothetical protein